VKVLLVVIDAASPRVVCPAVQTGRLPNLKLVADAGSMHQSSVSIFPSITPAATASIITGAYPAEHGIAGAAWYDEARNEVAYYGDDFWVIAREGFGAFLRDFLVRLNGDRLTAPTLFELVERTGRRAASVNYLVYRGLVPHAVNVPLLMSLIPGVPFTEEVHGPSTLCLGDFVTPRTARGRKVKARGGPLHRFGMDDASSGAMLCELAEDNALGDFTVAYFADNDYRSHEVGPHAALPVVEAVDRALGDLFAAAGGAERFLQETCVVVTSDHGHCEILPAANAAVSLTETFSEFRQADFGRPWRTRDEILVCPNMRAAQIYVRQPSPEMLERLTRAAIFEERIDLVAWRSGGDGAHGSYHVASQAGRLEFCRGGRGPAHAPDPYATTWSWRGSADVLRLAIEHGQVVSSEYPNAFERIAGALDAPNSGEVWLTARPGCEFAAPGGRPHVGGGSHGALHALDSLSPVIAGGGGAPRLPSAMRSIDIAPLCMQVLGIPMRYQVGDPRGKSQG
jgi:hypothetical protein